jgi:hypothetical protein
MSIAHRNVESTEFPQGFSAVVTNAARAFDFAARCQQELVRFSGYRLSRYLDLQSQLRDCGNPLDAMKAQMDFMVKTQADYLKQSTAFAEGLIDTGAAMAGALEELPLTKAVEPAAESVRTDMAASDSEVSELTKGISRKPRHAA